MNELPNPIACLGLAGVVLLSACGQAPAVVEDRPLPVKAVLPVAHAPRDAVRYPATLARDQEATLAFRVGGVVRRIDIRPGDTVRSGQVLAELDPSPELAARAKAQADLEKLERAKRRNQDLLPAGAISQGADQDTASSVEAAHAALDSAIYDEASAVLRAPFDGVVLARRAEIGEMLAPGQQALTLAAVGSPWLARAAIPAAVARTLRPGQMATLMLRQGTQSTQVRVRHIGALADPHTGSVQVDFVGAQGLAPTSGELGSIQVIAPDTRAQPDAQRLPPEALLDVHGTTGHVFAIDRTTGSAHLLTVEVLGIDEEDLLVRGIAPDTKIITSGAGFASEGKKVLEIAP